MEPEHTPSEDITTALNNQHQSTDITDETTTDEKVKIEGIDQAVDHTSEELASEKSTIVAITRDPVDTNPPSLDIVAVVGITIAGMSIVIMLLCVTVLFIVMVKKKQKKKKQKKKKQRKASKIIPGFPYPLAINGSGIETRNNPAYSIAAMSALGPNLHTSDDVETQNNPLYNMYLLNDELSTVLNTDEHDYESMA